MAGIHLLCGSAKKIQQEKSWTGRIGFLKDELSAWERRIGLSGKKRKRANSDYLQLLGRNISRTSPRKRIDGHLSGMLGMGLQVLTWHSADRFEEWETRCALKTSQLRNTVLLPSKYKYIVHMCNKTLAISMLRSMKDIIRYREHFITIARIFDSKCFGSLT